MLRTGFIGNENFFDRAICEWLGGHTDLALVIWTNQLSWGSSGRSGRLRRVGRRFLKRVKQRGILRTLDEALYYVLYRSFLQRGEGRRLLQLVDDLPRFPRRSLSLVPQIRPRSIADPTVAQSIRKASLDALFATCIDVRLPDPIIDAPRLGSFLWHEGIAPEYRGVYSPFWGLVRGDYENLGYTLLRMTSRLDGGENYVQGRVVGVDPGRDWHSYIGHKAILDSLQQVERFLIDLEAGRHRPIRRDGALDALYSYPTATGLLKIVRRRLQASRGGTS